MDSARIAALLAPFLNESEPLAAVDLSNISTYIDILQRWNARINLTAILDPEQIVTRHFGESLFAARHLFPSRTYGEVIAVADVGSGAGFPGIPIKLWAPRIHLTLIESNHKKATFLREVARGLTLTGIDIQNTRAEFFSSASFDLVTLRAVERFETVLTTAATLVRPAGRLALLIGSAQAPRIHSALRDFHCSAPLPIPSSRARVLLICHRGENPASQPVV